MGQQGQLSYRTTGPTGSGGSLGLHIPGSGPAPW
eukprot:CAMPEP_0174379310 /NCGR_PEP_ID=MMETSP0811_2-20130205/122621_1 /TAXON_ID=73025 ORGANISM="Eutreptiella gymnastica-like, Strain CCMP1594" /NCGR_SAMPLE_ID=MMETSP0811_2 /ASSEMBLY_ACC=CAM_ASM_000667 /LENGTH=33 /DNA_ID= /DNA_START= /DNA_END= /DNA_ORIENTATION=